jgi:hypothetical protein
VRDVKKWACLFDGQQCSGQGEHVLTRWFPKRYVKRYDGSADDPRFFIEVNGEPVTSRDGAVVWRDHIATVMLPPVCSDCNNWLNNTFEVPAKPYVRSALDDLQPLAGPGVVALARWAAKTLLLARHPDAAYEGLRDRVPRAWVLPDDLLPRMRKTGQLPDDLSLWAAVIDSASATTPAPRVDPVVLPRTMRSDGAGGVGNATVVGFDLPKLSRQARVEFQLIYHPLMNITHPLEAAGLVIRLWPNPPDSLDLAALPRLDEASAAQLGRAFAVGLHAVGLGPGERWSEQMLNDALSAGRS